MMEIVWLVAYSFGIVWLVGLPFALVISGYTIGNNDDNVTSFWEWCYLSVGVCLLWPFVVGGCTMASIKKMQQDTHEKRHTSD